MPVDNSHNVCMEILPNHDMHQKCRWKWEVKDMLDKREICQKVTEFNPDLGVCGIDVETVYSRSKRSWVVASKKGDHDIIHFLDRNDIVECLDDTQCVSLGLDIALLKEY